MPEQIQNILDNLRSLGTRRLAIMAGIAALVMTVIVAGALYLNKPAYETLYVGLERADVNQMGLVLGEAGIAFDVAADGTAILVPAGKTAQARMLLAEKGLPMSSNAGYELFDNVGSLGLTTFMQQITRLRALEGEIARTITSISGIKAARVHIVLPERASFRQEEQKPSASVVIRTTGGDASGKAAAIRHLVAAAVPGLDPEEVTILDSSGVLLAAGDDPSNNSAQRALGVERTVEQQVAENIRRALAPYLGPENFRASVAAVVDTDTREIQEVIFDPDSRVARSVQVVRTSESSNERRMSTPTSVEQNLPEEETPAVEGPSSSEQTERREETTNYEINSKRINTTSNGYTVTKLSIAVVVDSKRLMETVGPKATPEQVKARIAEIRDVVASAAGFDEKRGDVLNVSAVEFIDGLDGEPVPQPGVLDRLSRHAGTIINAAAFVFVVFLVTWFGLRPLAAALVKPPTAGFPAQEANRSLPNPAEQADRKQLTAAEGDEVEVETETVDDIRAKIRPAPQERLARMVDLSEERTAQILRKWVNAEAEAKAG